MPELERTVGLMKRVVERLQRENESLKRSTATASPDRVAALERENAELKVDGWCWVGGEVGAGGGEGPADL